MVRVLLVCISLALIAATVVPLFSTNEKWVRVFDFPRAQIAILLLVTLVAFILAAREKSVGNILIVIALIAAIGWQFYRIFPYTPFAPVPVQESIHSDSQSCFRLAVANVHMKNRDAGMLIGLMRRADPDVVLFVETDDWWDKALSTFESSHLHSIHQPQDNTYGMVLYSRFPFESSRIAFLTDDNIPSIHAQFRLPSGQRVAFYGVHPVPPPLADTTQRDAELLAVAKLAKASPNPAVVAGDLNDVGWSKTTTLFQEISGLLDPRHGRGFYASYNAENPFLRWPLDHVFHDPVFTLRELRLLDAFGSDHFPVFIHLCREPVVKEEQSRPEASSSQKSEANRKIEKGKAAEPLSGD